MFSSNGKPIPPPPTNRPRNESHSTLPTYRNRPTGIKDLSSTAHSIFDAISKPEVRSGLAAVAQNPAAQRAFVSAAKNETVRQTAFSAAQNPNVRNAVFQSFANQQAPTTAQRSNNASAPMLGYNPPMSFAPSGQQNQWNSPAKHSFNNELEELLKMPSQKPIVPPKDSAYTKLTQKDPFSFPPKLPSSSGPDSEAKLIDVDTDPLPTWSPVFGYGPASTTVLEKKPAPERPPPPRMTSRSNPNLFGMSLAPVSPISFTQEPHAIVKYPYHASTFDELSCQANDTVLLKREVDGQKVYAMNTRTGESGTVPLTFLHVKVPLVPTSSSTYAPSNFNNYPIRTSTSDYTGFGYGGNNTTPRARALYDYDTGVDGDLLFNAGDWITLVSRVNEEWLRGELGGRRGIFPQNYVQIDKDALHRLSFEQSAKSPGSTSVVGSVSRTVVAAFDYAGEADDDLSFKAGDKIEVIEEKGNDWILGRLRNGCVGLVPLTFCHR